jgi:hypothetical protein
MDDDAAYIEQNNIFERLYARINKLLEKFGRRDSLLADGDYSVYGDYWGYPQVKVTISNLELLRPNVVNSLRGLIKEFPGWEIVVAVAVDGHLEDWPEMGLYIRPHEIIDGLQRQYFPKEFQDIRYEGGRPGTDRD